jgi:hypothetical protein
MKILVFDPLYSSIGHFYRYNKFILNMLSDIDVIKEITYIDNENEGKDYTAVSNKIKIYNPKLKNSSFQIKTMQIKGIFDKVSLHYNALGRYRTIVDYINKSDYDFVFFTSAGQISFWLALRQLKVPYIVSPITIKWLYDKFSLKHLLYSYYLEFLKKADFVFITEEYLREVILLHGINKVAVLHDRYLNPKSKDRSDSFSSDERAPLNLLTIGTISDNKNPIQFLELLHSLDFSSKNVIYKIVGKSIDESGKIVKELSHDFLNVHFIDKYLTQDDYLKYILEADFIVIPYEWTYTRYVTSGVMWDCFEHRKPIICPFIEPFKSYIKKYRIGFLYDYKTIDKLIEEITSNRVEIINQIKQNYINLYEDKKYQTIFLNFSNDIRAILKK